MTKMYDIYIAFVSWGDEGKRRPILILDVDNGKVKAFSITTQYMNKSEEIRARYLAINDWKQAGLNRPSYIDTNQAISIPLPALDNTKPIGKLSVTDETRLIEFIKP